MNAKENLLRTLTVNQPECVPDMLKDFRYLIGQAENRGDGGETIMTGFGVHWTSSGDGPGLRRPLPTGHCLEDIFANGARQ